MPSSITAGLKQPNAVDLLHRLPIGTCQDALDAGCGLYRTTPLLGPDTRRTYGRDH
jgi:hypothetical protein